MTVWIFGLQTEKTAEYFLNKVFIGISMHKPDKRAVPVDVGEGPGALASWPSTHTRIIREDTAVLLRIDPCGLWGGCECLSPPCEYSMPLTAHLTSTSSRTAIALCPLLLSAPPLACFPR